MNVLQMLEHVQEKRKITTVMITQKQLVSDYHIKQVREGVRGQAHIIWSHLKFTTLYKIRKHVSLKQRPVSKRNLYYRKSQKKNIL